MLGWLATQARKNLPRQKNHAPCTCTTDNTCCSVHTKELTSRRTMIEIQVFNVQNELLSRMKKQSTCDNFS